MSFSDLLIIIEPADMETSFSVDEPTLWDDELRAPRMAAQIGLNRIRKHAHDGRWTRPYGGGSLVSGFAGWMTNARERVVMVNGARATHERERSTNPFGDGRKLTRIGLSVIRDA